VSFNVYILDVNCIEYRSFHIKVDFLSHENRSNTKFERQEFYMITKEVLTRGIATYQDENSYIHKCFAVSNGELFVFWLGGIYVANASIQAEFEPTNELTLHHFKTAFPGSEKAYQLMEKHFELCLELSQMEHPDKEGIKSFGFDYGKHMKDMPDFGEEFEGMHLFHLNSDEAIHAVFGEPVDEEYRFAQMMFGAVERLIHQLRKERIQERIYRGLHQVDSFVLEHIGFKKPVANKKESRAFFEVDRGNHELFEDNNQSLHVFSRLENNLFSYQCSFKEWLDSNFKTILKRHDEYEKKVKYMNVLIHSYVTK